MWIETEDGNYVASEHIGSMSKPGLDGIVDLYSADSTHIGKWNTETAATFGDLDALRFHVHQDILAKRSIRDLANKTSDR